MCYIFIFRYRLEIGHAWNLLLVAILDSRGYVFLTQC